jgi:hypothetical protein
MNADLPSDFDAALLGLSLPAVAALALQEASALRGDAQAELAALMRAQAAAPEHPAVLIALYRYHFYGHRLQPARAVARRALVVGARALGLPELWRELPRSALPGARHDPGTRFYLFALKGLAYLSLRLGDGSEARDALALLRALDPEDRIGAALLEGVRQRALRRGQAGADDDADDDGDDGDDGAATATAAATVQATGSVHAALRQAGLATGAAAWAALAPAAGDLP